MKPPNHKKYNKTLGCKSVLLAVSSVPKVFYVKKETAKMKTEIKLTPKSKYILQQIRDRHIDINPLLQEELDNILPTIIENVIENMYNMMEVK